MSVCFAEKPADASRAFVYSLLGDVDPTDTARDTTEALSDPPEIPESPPPTTDLTEDVQKEESATPEIEVEVTTCNQEVLGAEATAPPAEGDSGSVHEDRGQVELKCEEMQPPIAKLTPEPTPEVDQPGSVSRDQNDADGQSLETESEGRAEAIPEEEGHGVENSGSEFRETEEVKVFAAEPNEEEIATERNVESKTDAGLPDLLSDRPEVESEVEVSTFELQQLRVELPQELFLPSATSDEASLDEAAASAEVHNTSSDVLSTSSDVHNTSSDGSEAYVTAANSEEHDSLPETQESGWSPTPPDVQPDSLEAETEGGDGDPEPSPPGFVLVEGGSTSLSYRTPKKLFEEDGPDQKEPGGHNLTMPDVNLKELEGRSLREMERERRRIIDNQTVRRKKIDYWAFASQQEAQRPPADPPTPPVSPVPRLGRVSPGALPKGWSSSPAVLRSVSPPVPRALPPPVSSPTPEPSPPSSLNLSEPQLEPEPEPETEPSPGPASLRSEDGDSSASLPDSVDCASILENKERLRLFWESRIMAEQETNAPAPAAPAEEGTPAPDPSPPDSLESEAPVAEEAGEQSAQDSATRSAPEGEQEVKEEPAEQTEPKPEAETEKSSPPQSEDPVPAVVPDSPAAMEVRPPEVEAETEEPLVTLEETPAVPPEVESGSPDVVPEADSRPQVVGETYQPVSEVVAGDPAVPRSPPAGAPAALPPPRSERPPFNPAADSKIAQELQEMRAREEELRLMRENKGKQEDTPAPAPAPPPPPPQPPQQEPVVVEEEKRNGHADHATPPAYNLGYAFGRRKDGVKVRPLSDDGQQNGRVEGAEEARQGFPVLKESPIEKEIREARERETELKKEKAVALSPQQQEDAANKRPSSLHLNGGGPWRGVTNGGVKSVSDTQRFLATNRIQQEIVEQTEREMALRASGKIQTISQERTDAKVTRLRDVTSPAEKRALLLSSSPPTSPALSSSASDKSDKSGHSPGPVNGTTNGHHPKTPSPSSSVSGSQVAQSPTANGGGRRFSNPPQVRGVSMQRFIASKGRELAFSAFGTKGQRSSSALGLHDRVRDPGPGPVPAPAPPNLNGTAKRCVPAETKIQVELREMQAREDELRQQRARLLGMSQPNLSSLGTDEDLGMSNGHHPAKREGPDGMDRAASNPNLLDDEQYDEDNEKISVGGPRRRSMLIDQWEKRIQKTEDVKAT